MIGNSDSNRSESQGGVREDAQLQEGRSEGTTVGTRNGREAGRGRLNALKRLGTDYRSRGIAYSGLGAWRLSISWNLQGALSNKVLSKYGFVLPGSPSNQGYPVRAPTIWPVSEDGCPL